MKKKARKAIRKAIDIITNNREIIIPITALACIIVILIGLYFILIELGRWVTVLGIILLVIIIINELRRFFIINVVSSFVIIMLILYVLFKIAPHTAFISFRGSEEDIVISSNADMVRIDCGKTSADIVSTNKDGEISLHNYKIYRNDALASDASASSLPSLFEWGIFFDEKRIKCIKLKGGFQISVIDSDINSSLKSDETPHDLQTIKKNITISARTNYDMNSLASTPINLLENYLESDFSYLEEDKVSKYLGVIIKHMIIDWYEEYIYPVFLQDFFSHERELGIYYDSIDGRFDINNPTIECVTSVIKIHPLTDDCKLEMLDEKMKVIETKEVNQEFVVEPLDNGIIYFKDCCSIVGNEKAWNVEIYGANKLQSKVTGNLSFVYSNNPTELELTKRNIVMRSKQGGINFMSSSDDVKQAITFDGEISSARLSGIDLFPSFGTWYRENVYLVPLTMITTIFVSVQLMQASVRDKHKGILQVLIQLCNKTKSESEEKTRE